MPALLMPILVASHAASAQVEPSNPHPRLFMDAKTQANLRELARQGGTVVAATVRRCREIEASPQSFSRDGYMGLDWAQYLQACLISWQATGSDGAARTAIRYFRALLDDLQVVGDGKGGDAAASRDSGYAIRALGPNAALAYDWLHDAPGVDAALLARARQRFKAWTDWYVQNGYRARSPGTNYNAGYFFAATLIAIAQGGEAGEDGTRLWRHVVDDLFEKDLMPSMSGGVLRGGDWGEGWQYGPLSIAEYALAARAVASYGVEIGPTGSWLKDIVIRHIHALTPSGDRTYAVGDADLEAYNLPVRRDTLTAVVAGPAPHDAKQWAMSELLRLRLMDDRPDFPLFSALAEAERVPPSDFPRPDSPKTFLARGTSILYARSNWSSDAIWFVTPCSGKIDVDHTHPNAGSFVLTRGSDDLIVDPSPYGTLSSLTSNAPTVLSENMPDHYRPSQAFWGTRTGFRWIATQDDGAVAARCDYADQYRIQETPTDIPLAFRDLLLIPYRDADGGQSALLFIQDRSVTRTAKQPLYLRFRSPSALKPLEGSNTASGRVGRSNLLVRRLAASGGMITPRKLQRGSCFTENFTRGNCDAARIEVGEIAEVVPGPQARAMHLIEAASQKQALADPVALAASGGSAWSIERAGARWVVAAQSGNAAMSYSVPAANALHYFLPASPGGSTRIRVSASRTADECRVTIGGSVGVEVAGTPGIFAVNADCNVTEGRSARLEIARESG